MPKYDQLAEQFKERVLHGDYAIRGLPAERQLALDSGVSYMTARRAVQHLIDEGFLMRGATGRIELKRLDSNDTPRLQLAFVAPVDHLPEMRIQLTAAAERFGARVRPVLYRNWDDPIIGDALDGFDGVFFRPSTEPMSRDFVRSLREARCPVFVLEEDMSHEGLPSVRSTAPTAIDDLILHLKEQGHRRLGCINVQGYTCGANERRSVVELRIEQWNKSLVRHGLNGWLIDEPTEPHGLTLPRAHALAKRLLANGQFECDALLGITLAAAMGSMRAMLDVGLEPGRDVAVCTIDGEGFAAYLNPSLTAVEPFDVTPFFVSCIEWIIGGATSWQGPLLMEPTQPTLVIRDSTKTPNPLTRRMVLAGEKNFSFER